MAKPIPRAFGAFLLILIATLGPAPAEDTSKPDRSVQVYYFWQDGCPHCARAMAFLPSLEERWPSVSVQSFEVSRVGHASDLYRLTVLRLGIERPAVPLIVVGERYFLGYDRDETSGRAISQAVGECFEVRLCPDLIGALQRSLRTSGTQARGELTERPAATATELALPETVDLPFIGSVGLASLSLPLLTVVLAAADGFNPCAMWVLIFLIGLLLGMEDRRRMWLLGGAFLFATAAVYLVFMAAWLNVFLLLGALVWIRYAVGLFALGAGGYYLHQFAVQRGDSCPVTSPGQRRRIMDWTRLAVSAKRLEIAVAAVVLVAVAVNLVELLCSAGLPAIYTEVLALNLLPTWQHYGYLLLYIVVFLLDDAIVFVVAMITLTTAGLTGRYARFAHLLGGLTMGGIGILLIVKPEWLSLAG